MVVDREEHVAVELDADGQWLLRLLLIVYIYITSYGFRELLDPHGVAKYLFAEIYVAEILLQDIACVVVLRTRVCGTVAQKDHQQSPTMIPITYMWSCSSSPTYKFNFHF